MNKMFLYGEIGGEISAPQIAKDLNEMSGDIELRINSSGGYVAEAVTIANNLRNYMARGYKVTAFVDGIAASAASYLLCAANKAVAGIESQIMIHEPSSGAFGRVKDFEAGIEHLKQIRSQMINAYANKTGKSVDEIAAVMEAETWLDPEQALKFGIVDEIAKASTTTMASKINVKGGYKLIKEFQESGLPETEMAAAETGKIPNSKDQKENIKMSEVKTETKIETTNEAVTMAAPTAPTGTVGAVGAVNNEAVTMAVEAEKERCDRIIKAAGMLGVSMADTQEIIRMSLDVAASQEQLMAKMVKDDPAQCIAKMGGQSTVSMMQDGIDKMRAGMEKAILARAGASGGERNEFTNMSLIEMATAQHNAITGERLAGSGGANLPALMSHSTSDFPAFLGGIIDRKLEGFYKEADETYETWTGTGSYKDFRAAEILHAGLVETLHHLPEGGEVKETTFNTGGRTAKLKSYGIKIHLTRESLINDDLGLFNAIPSKTARSVKRTIANAVYDVFIDNPNMQDGKKLFHADHNNYITGAKSALSQSAVTEAKKAMRKQKDADKIVKNGLNLKPKYLIVGSALEGLAVSTFTSATNAEQTNSAVVNPNSGLTIVVDSRLDDVSETAWAMATDYNLHGTVEVGYLNGKSTPTLIKHQPWDQRSLVYFAGHDFSVTPVDYRGLYLSMGQ